MKKILRIKGIIFLGVLIGIFILLSFVFTDRWLENQMEDYGSLVVGAKVEVDGLYFSTTDLILRWNRLQVTDPRNTMTNLFETTECDLDIDPFPLLSKKLNIENITVKGLKFNTPRETDGKLSDLEKQALEEGMPDFVKELHQNLKDEAAHMPVFNVSQFTRKINVDSVYAMLELQSPQKMDSLKNASEQKYNEWENRIAELPSEEDFKEIETQINSIDPNKLNDIDELKNTLVVGKSLKDKLSQYRTQYDALKNNFDSDLKQLKRAPGDAQKWIQADYRRALSLAKLPDLSVKNVAKLLFGQRILDQIETITGYIGTARYYADKFKSSAPEKESPPRLQGQYVHFGKYLETPKFWIKKMDLSGELSNGLQLAGNAENIVSSQKNIDQPTSLVLGGSRSDKTALNLNALFDYRDESPRENISLKLDHLPLNGTKLTDFALLPSKIAKGSGFISADINFEADNFLSEIQFTGTQLKFDAGDKPQNLNPQLAKISHSITNAMTEVKFNTGIRQTDGKFNFNINSNIDNLIARELKQLASDEVIAARQNLEAKVTQETGKYKQELDAFVNEKVSSLVGEVQVVGDLIDEYEAELETLKKETEKKIEKKAAGKLLDIFK